MYRRIAAAAGLALLMAMPAAARDIDFSDISQPQFRRVAEEAGGALSYKNAAPAAPLGITGFEVAAQASFIPVDTDAWDKALEGNAPEGLLIPTLRARKGLPFGIDVGAMYSYVPDSNIQLVGAEISKAILEGTVATPALGIRGTYTRLLGVDELDFQTAGIDASISKGFLFITPYAGAGMVYVAADPKGVETFLGDVVKEEKFWQPRYFAGLELKPLPLFRLLADVEYSQRFIYTLKVGIGF